MDHHFIQPSDNTAFLTRTSTISYRDFVQQISALSMRLTIEVGDRVVLYGPSNVDWARALYAVWHRGGIAVPLDFNAGLEDLSAMLRDAEPAMVLMPSAQPGQMLQALEATRLEPRVLHLDETGPVTPGQTAPVDRPLDETAVILYTSGTTADAKGVELSFRSLLFNIEAVRLSGMVNDTDRLLALFPFHHIVPLQGHILCPLKLGATVCTVETLDADSIVDAFQRYQITVLNGVPQLYQRFHGAILKKVRASLAGRTVWRLTGILPWQGLRKKLFKAVHNHFGGHIKYLLSGGAALPKSIADDFSRLGFTMVEGYGMTEMGPLITFNTPQENRHGSVGKPVPGVELRFEAGELWVRSPGRMNGYFRRPDLTRQVIRDGWLQTGDLGELDHEGFLTLTGRKSDVLVLSSGKNVNAPKIETFLGDSELILEAGLTVRENRLFALFHPDMAEVHRQGILNLHEAIKWRLLDGYNRKCSPHERILDFGISPKPLPRTRLGKLKRHLLGGFVEPSGNRDQAEGIERIDPRIVSYLRAEGITGLHPRAHLTIDLGLDSLALIEFKRHLERAFDRGLADTIFLEYPSLEELDRSLRQEADRGRQNSAELRPPRQRTLFEGGFRGWIRPVIFLAGLPFRVRKKGLEHFEDQTRPMIIVSNHQSFLDPLFILRILPGNLSRKTFFMAKTRIFNSFVGRLILPRLNTVLLDLHQSGDDLLRQCRDILHQGKNLMIFPEGTRSFDGRLGAFSRTFALLAHETGASIVPLTIKGAFELMPRTRLMPRFGRVELTVMPPIPAPHPHPAALQTQVYDLFKSQMEVRP
jgi:long-chain acyl-CoA synthetase